MKKIEKLTSEQEADLPVFRQKYLNMACDGKRIDRTKIEPAIFAAYDFIGAKRPLVVILQSPLQAMMTTAFFKNLASVELGGQLRDQLWDQLWDQLRGQLWDQLWDQLGGQLWDQLGGQLGGQLGDQLGGQLGGQLRDQLWDQLRDQLRDQLGDQLRDQLGDQLWDQLWDQLRGQLWDQLGGQLWDQLGDQSIYDFNYLWGAQDLYWIGWARFAQKIGVKLDDDTNNRLSIMENISTQCEWWWPYEGVCFVSEKPTGVNWDDRGLLHSETGAAVKYDDGYSVYSWHGTNIPQEWINNKDSLNPEVALTWGNVEQRRCAAEILGWHNILSHPSLSARTIDKDSDTQIGELIEVDIPGIGTERFLKVQCGTGRMFALPVPPDSKTALAANAWTYGLDPEDYNVEVRT